ncbi:MAG: ribonuclease P protein component [Cytophagales bacterium]
MGKVFRFSKSERLCSKKEITELFDKGVSVFSYPFKIYFLPKKEASFFSVLISCPKKKFPKSVDRKKIIRKIREAYRLQKHNFHEELGIPFGSFAIIFLGKEILEHKVLFEKLNNAFRRLRFQIDANENKEI